MKRIHSVFLGCLLLLSAGFVQASEHELNARLILNQIKVLKTTERAGDELYFDISVYRPGQSTQYLRVPKQPIHWPSGIIERVKDVSVWTETLKSGQAVTLIVSLIDSDRQVLNPDDLIGSMQVELKNMDGELHVSWSIPNRVEGPVTTVNQNEDVQKFELRGRRGQYDVYLSLKK